MRSEVYQAVKLLLELDPTVSAEHGKRILDVCRRQSFPTKKRLGTLKQAAAILQCDPRTVSRYVVKGRISAIWHSRRKVRYDLDEIERFASRGTSGLD